LLSAVVPRHEHEIAELHETRKTRTRLTFYRITHDSSYFRSQGEAILGKKGYIDKRGSSALFKHR
jgi:hypothetical protein